MEWFSNVARRLTSHTPKGKASLAAKFFQKLFEKRRAILKTHFNALKYVFYRYKSR